MVVDTQLGLQIQALSQVESQCRITEDLRVVAHTTLQIQDHHGVRHTLETEHVVDRRRGRSGIVTILILNRQPRQHLDHRTTCLLATTILRCVTAPSVVHQYVHSRWQPRCRVGIVGHLGVDTLVVGIVHDTLLIGVVQESTHRGVLAGLLDIQLVVVRNRCASSLVLPVRIVNRITIGIEVITIIEPIRTVQWPTLALVFVLVLQTLHEGIAPLRSGQCIHLAGDVACADRTLVADLYTLAILLTTLRRNHDDTVRTTRTIDSGCGSILQHLHRLNIVRVHQVEVLHYDTIDHIQRVRRCVDSCHTTDHDAVRISTRLAGVREDVHTRHLTTQVVQCREVLVLGQLITLSDTDRTCDIWFTHHTITNDYDLFQCLRVLAQRYVDSRLIAYGDLLGKVTDVREYQYIAGRYTLDGIVTVEIGDRTVCRTFNNYVGANHRLAGSVNDYTCHLLALLNDHSACVTCCHRGCQRSAHWERRKQQTEHRGFCYSLYGEQLRFILCHLTLFLN